MNQTQELRLHRLRGAFAVWKTSSPAEPPAADTWWFEARTPTECSVVCEESFVPSHATNCERGFAGFGVEGQLDFSLTGILARITGALAEASIPVFAVSTFDTDYVFVRESAVQGARDAWQKAGIAVT